MHNKIKGSGESNEVQDDRNSEIDYHEMIIPLFADQQLFFPFIDEETRIELIRMEKVKEYKEKLQKLSDSIPMFINGLRIEPDQLNHQLIPYLFDLVHELVEFGNLPNVIEEGSEGLYDSIYTQKTIGDYEFEFAESPEDDCFNIKISFNGEELLSGYGPNYLSLRMAVDYWNTGLIYNITLHGSSKSISSIVSDLDNLSNQDEFKLI